jgi:hypothetical protein
VNGKIKTLSLSAVVIALIAVVLPAASSAAELQAKSKPGVPLQIGWPIWAHSHNVIVTNTMVGTWECEEVTLGGELWKNSEGTVLLYGTAGETKVCSASGEPLGIDELTLQELRLTGSGAGAISLSFILRLGPFECPFEGEGPVSYQSGTNVVSVDNMPLESPFEFCEPEEGHSRLSGDFPLTKANGEAVLIVD